MSVKYPATCTVDPLGGMQYDVTVNGALHCAGRTRTYVLKATSERDAAMQALDQFADEMKCLFEGDAKDD